MKSSSESVLLYQHLHQTTARLIKIQSLLVYCKYLLGRVLMVWLLLLILKRLERQRLRRIEFSVSPYRYHFQLKNDRERESAERNLLIIFVTICSLSKMNYHCFMGRIQWGFLSSFCAPGVYNGPVHTLGLFFGTTEPTKKIKKMYSIRLKLKLKLFY